MKEKIHYVIEAALGIAVIVLFALFFSNNRKSDFSGTNSLDSGSLAARGSLPVAYIDVDSLLQKYQYSIDLNEQITRKYENSHANLTEKLRKLQSEITDFQRKVETGSFVSQESAQNQQQRLLKKQEELQQLEAQLSQELGEEQLRLNEDLRKKIISQLKEFNKNKGFYIIFGNIRDNILYADDVYNITSEAIGFLNKSYTTTPQIETSTPSAK